MRHGNGGVAAHNPDRVTTPRWGHNGLSNHRAEGGAHLDRRLVIQRLEEWDLLDHVPVQRADDLHP